MKPLLTIGGIALIGYALYEWFYGPQGVAATTATGFAASTPTAGAPTAAAHAPAITAQALITAAGGQTALDADQWNYYYSILSGVHQTADLFDPANRTALIDAQTYLNRRAAKGLSGFLTQASRTPQRFQLNWN